MKVPKVIVLIMQHDEEVFLQLYPPSEQSFAATFVSSPGGVGSGTTGFKLLDNTAHGGHGNIKASGDGLVASLIITVNTFSALHALNLCTFPAQSVPLFHFKNIDIAHILIISFHNFHVS